MRVVTLAVATAALLLGVRGASAQDRQPCGVGYICASDPASVVKAMNASELAPQLTADNVGDPMIESDVGPFHYDVYFYGCEANVHCDSLRFEAMFEPGPENTVALANDWNAGKRFASAAVKADGSFVVSYDVGTIGGMNPRNFRDVLDWWESMLGELSSYFEARFAPGGTLDPNATKPVALRALTVH